MSNQRFTPEFKEEAVRQGLCLSCSKNNLSLQTGKP